MNRGKKKCMFLKDIRRSIAKKFGLRYDPVECTHTGDCAGTCPACDAEIIDLQQQLDAHNVTPVNQHLEPLDIDDPVLFDNVLGGVPDVEMPLEVGNNHKLPVDEKSVFNDEKSVFNDEEFVFNDDSMIIGGIPAPPYIDEKKDKK